MSGTANRQDLDPERKFIMRIHLVVGAILTALCSTAVFADPAAGLGQQPEPKVLHEPDPSAPCLTDGKSEPGRGNSGADGALVGSNSADRTVHPKPETRKLSGKSAKPAAPMSTTETMDHYLPPFGE
jgi:hypothetical protein